MTLPPRRRCESLAAFTAALSEGVKPPVHRRIARVSDFDSRRPLAGEQPIRRRSQLGDDALAVASADFAEEIDLPTDDVIRNEYVIASTHDAAEQRLAADERHVAQIVAVRPQNIAYERAQADSNSRPSDS
jgi:pyruvate kinase